MSEIKPKIANEMNLTAAELRREYADALRLLSETADERDSARADLLDAAETERQLRARIAHLEAQVVELEQKDTRAVRAYYRVAEQRDALRAENAKLQQAVETWAKGHDAANARADRLADENAHLLECHAPDEYLRLREERDRLAGVVEADRAAFEWIESECTDELERGGDARHLLYPFRDKCRAAFAAAPPAAKCDTCERVRGWGERHAYLLTEDAYQELTDILDGTDGGDDD